MNGKWLENSWRWNDDKNEMDALVKNLIPRDESGRIGYLDPSMD